ncbi:hypothetical protein ACHQM5_018133 [Ranunculus cassubicifolius]
MAQSCYTPVKPSAPEFPCSSSINYLASAPEFHSSPAPSVAQSFYPPVNHISVISPQFCAPYPVDLTAKKKLLTITDGNFSVRDVNGNFRFKVKGAMLSLRKERVLLDAAGNPLVSISQKMFSLHSRWEVHRGDSSSDKDHLFSVRKSSMLQFKPHLDVFLASNTKEHVRNFKIKGDWLGNSSVISLGESSNIVAQIHKKYNLQSVMLGKDTFMVTVYSHVDYAFIVSLFVILNEINQDRSRKNDRRLVGFSLFNILFLCFSLLLYYLAPLSCLPNSFADDLSLPT